YLAPDGRASFNVAIRTVVIDRQHNRATYGVGGGIVWDSEAELEYEECFLKAQVLVQRRPSFELLETMRWTPEEGFFLLDLHLQRLAESADYFQFALDLPQVERLLAEEAASFKTAMRVRLLVDRQGAVTIQAHSLALSSQAQTIRCHLAACPISSREVWLYHKTTNRSVYEEARAARPSADEVILWNEAGELTEGTIANLVLDLDGRLLTPPVTCGLLNGTLRRHLLHQGEIQEKVLGIADLYRARKVWLINSVRGWQEVLIVEEETAYSK
ncbi:MAG: aminotransferase class IV, partial [Candidatus Promineifilaceae bacterium]